MTKVLSDYLSSNPTTYQKRINDRKLLQTTAEKKCLNIFQQASSRIPAYKDFLKKYSIDPKTIKTIADFTQVPYASKENYINAYPLAKRCWDGVITNTHMFAASSGSTGEPSFWPRQLEQEIEGAIIHEYLLEKAYDVRNKKTLFINSFGLGNWIAGIYTQNCLYLNRLNNLPFTLANPGYNQEETFKVVKEFSKHYDQTIIACHPPILKMMVENGINKGINWKNLNTKFLSAAEGFSENWRDYLMSLVGQDDPTKTILNIYGSADAGLMGFETPLSIALHRETSTNHQLNQLLFQNERNPYLYQFDPTMRYLESIDNSITITMNATMPLIRYNIHDHGGTIDNSQFIKTLESASPKLLKYLKTRQIDPETWPLPFVYIFGRDQFMVTLYGVNIYPENLKAVFEHPELQTHLTGRFITEKSTNNQQNPYLLIRLELKPDTKESKALKSKTKKLFISTLKQLNSEYDQVEAKFNDKMHPQIKFHTYHHPKFFPEGKTIKTG